ncbi:hypothetical protein GQ457_07G024160 [Hibiscus cannabinus]
MHLFSILAKTISSSFDLSLHLSFFLIWIWLIRKCSNKVAQVLGFLSLMAEKKKNRIFSFNFLFLLTKQRIMCESQNRQATEGNSTAGGKINDNNEWEKESASRLVGDVSLGDLIWIKLHGNSWWPAVVVDEKSVSESSKPGSKSRGKALCVYMEAMSSQFFVSLLDYCVSLRKILYADPMKYHSEFKTILEQKNGNCYDILDKTLEQVIANTGADASRGKTSKQDETPKKLKRKSPCTDEQAKSKADEQSTVQTKQRKNNQTAEKKKPNSRTVKEKPKSSTSKEQKKGKTSKKSKSNNPTTSKEKILLEKTASQSPEGTLPGESPKSGTRRTRVMQGLGLIAPPGSPFDRNGPI